MLPDEKPTREQIEIYRRMTPQQRWAQAVQLYWTARKLKATGLRAEHPDWSEEQIEREVVRIFSNART